MSSYLVSGHTLALTSEILVDIEYLVSNGEVSESDQLTVVEHTTDGISLTNCLIDILRSARDLTFLVASLVLIDELIDITYRSEADASGAWHFPSIEREHTEVSPCGCLIVRAVVPSGLSTIVSSQSGEYGRVVIDREARELLSGTVVGVGTDLIQWPLTEKVARSGHGSYRQGCGECSKPLIYSCLFHDFLFTGC